MLKELNSKHFVQQVEEIKMQTLNEGPCIYLVLNFRNRVLRVTIIGTGRLYNTASGDLSCLLHAAASLMIGARRRAHCFTERFFLDATENNKNTTHEKRNKKTNRCCFLSESFV